MVLDSSAIVSIFKQEPGFEILERKIDQAEAVRIGATTLTETAIALARLTGKDPRAVLDSYLR